MITGRLLKAVGVYGWLRRRATGVSRLYRGRWLLCGVFRDLVEKRAQCRKNRSGIRHFALQPGDRANAAMPVVVGFHRVRAHDECRDQE